MARCKEDLKWIPRQTRGISGFQIRQLPLVIIEGHIPHQASGRREIQDLLFQLVNMRYQAPFFSHKLIPKHMIQMTMRIQQQYRPEPFLLNELDKLILFFGTITAGINNHSLLLLVKQHIGILLNRAKYENFNVIHVRSFVGQNL